MESSVRIHGFSGGGKASTTATIKGRRIKVPKTMTVMRFTRRTRTQHSRVEESQIQKRRQLCISQGAQACYCKVSRNHKSEKDDSSAFRDDKKREVTSDPSTSATWRLRHITHVGCVKRCWQDTFTVLHWADLSFVTCVHKQLVTLPHF